MFNIHKDGYDITIKTFTFPGGEVSVQLDQRGNPDAKAPASCVGFQTIVARLKSANDVMTLAMLNDALVRLDPKTPRHLFMPYIPYARQDRVCNPGEAFSLKVFADMINAMGFDKVTVLDPHSDVVAGVFNNLKVINQTEVIHKWNEFTARILRPDVALVSPDAGANKKISATAGYLGHDKFIRADKYRDMATGKIKETIVYGNDLFGQITVIIDDIADGGKTFIELAKVLKKKGSPRVILFVTHGIFSKGPEALFEDNLIDEVWTTNSFRDDIVDSRVKVLDANIFLK